MNSPEMVGFTCRICGMVRGPRYARYFVPTLFVLLKAVARPILYVAINPRRVEEVHTAQFQFWANDVTERVKTILASKERRKRHGA